MTAGSSPARWPWELLALPALALAHVFPETGAGLYVRLVAATLCLLVPGALVARALGQQSVFAALSWSLAGLTAASAMMFAVEGPLWWALALYAGIGAVALPFTVMRPLRRPSPFVLGVAAAGIAFGIALWAIAGQLDGDALFHLARIRKLEAFDNLGLESVNEFVDGGLHPGYAFPLWHVLMGLVAWLAGVDPGAALLHEPSVLVPVAFVVAYEAGVAILRTAWAGIAALLAAVALTGLAPGSGGAYTALSLPATSSRHLLVPATVAAFFVFVRKPGWAPGLTAAAASLALALVHPTYVIFVAVPLAGYVFARVALAREEIARGVSGLAFVLLPAAGVTAWLAPIVRDTASHSPSAAERARGLAHYPGQVDVFSADSFRLAPEMLGRAGAVAIAALVVVPLAAFASRRRWSAYVLGGSVAMLAILLIQQLFTPFCRCGVALAGKARGRLRAARGGLRRRSGGACKARVMVGATGGARGGDRSRARVPGRVRVPPRRGRSADRSVDRARGRRRRADRRGGSRQEGSARRSWAAVGGGRRGLRVARCDLRPRPLGRGAVRAVAAHSGARRAARGAP